MQNQTHLCSSAAGNLPFQHSVQSVFTVFTIKLLHEKLEDNELPCSAQQQRTWQSSFADSKPLMLLEHTVQRAPLLLDWGKLFQSVQIWEEFCVYSFGHETCWWNISNQSEVPWKCEPEEFYTWKNIKILIIILEINVSESGKGCDGSRVRVVNRPC